MKSAPKAASRRSFLRTGAGTAALTALSVSPGAKAAGVTGDIDPYPIPWLDANLHHNQIPVTGGAPVDLSHIWHFNGSVGRALLTGSGTTGDGQTLYIGQGTDFGYMQGEYITAGGRTQFGAFTHL